MSKLDRFYLVLLIANAAIYVGGIAQHNPATILTDGANKNLQGERF